MNDITPVKTTPITRDEARAKIFAAENTKGKTKTVKFFGTEIELHQPTVAQVLAMEKDAENRSFVNNLVEHAYIPGTTTKVFEIADIDTLKELPFNGDVGAVCDALKELTAMDLEASEKN